MNVFNEESLRADIARQWGEYGGHIDVFDMLIAQNKRLKEEIEQWRKEAQYQADRAHHAESGR